MWSRPKLLRQKGYRSLILISNYYASAVTNDHTIRSNHSALSQWWTVDNVVTFHGAGVMATVDTGHVPLVSADHLRSPHNITRAAPSYRRGQVREPVKKRKKSVENSTLRGGVRTGSFSTLFSTLQLENFDQSEASILVM